MAPECAVTTTKQLYLPDTNVLITRFLTDDGVGEVQDFMPVGKAGGGHLPCLVRRVVVVRGSMRFRLEVTPRFGYGRTAHVADRHPRGVVFRSVSLSLSLGADLPLELRDGDAYASFALGEGQSTALTLECVEERAQPRARSPEEVGQLFDDTVSYWRSWLSQSRYTGRWREMVHRSALTLKLLTYQPTGAIIAAPTTSTSGTSQRRGSPIRPGREEEGRGYAETWCPDGEIGHFAALERPAEIARILLRT